MFSQLFVRPNGTTDSYVYVSDEILFVEQDVNLEKNTNNAATEASIYLRDGAQLIQGTTASDNSGTGFLSVQQNTLDSNAWDYTYWCAPVGAQYMNGGSAGNKNFSIQRIFESTGLTSATVSSFTSSYNGSISPLTISKRWIYTHTAPGTEAEGAYQHVGQWHNIPPGYGFTMKGVGTGANPDQNYDFRGRPNNGTFSSYTVENGLMTLAGNPYPSALDMADVVSDNPAVGAIWYYDEDRDIDSHYYTDKRYGYGIWIPAGGALSTPGVPADGTTGSYALPTFREGDAGGGTGGGGTGGTGALYQRRFAPIGQGFMLIGNTTGTAYIDNSMRIYKKEGENSDFRNNDLNNSNDNRSPGDATIGIDPGDPDPDPILDRIPELRIVTSFYTEPESLHQREMVLLFSDLSTSGYDHGMDGMHPMDATSEIYFPIKNNGVESPYVIQTVPFYTHQRVPVNFKLSKFSKMTMSVVDEVNFNETAYLVDRNDNSFKKITGGDIAEIGALEAGEYKDRFYIVFQSRREANENSEGTILKEETRTNVDFFQNNPSKQLEIRNPEGYDIKTAMVYDMAGKLVISKSNLGTNNIITLSTSNVTDGIYLVRLLTSDNINIDHKMIIKNN